MLRYVCQRNTAYCPVYFLCQSTVFSVFLRCIFAVALVGSAVAAQAPACPHYVGFPGANETSTEPTANYTFVGDTQSCDALLPRNSSDLPPCADGDLVVELGTVAVLPNNSNM